MGKREEGFSGTTIKDTWTKPRGSGIRGGRWGWLGLGGVVGSKCRQLYLNNNKIKKNRHVATPGCKGAGNISPVSNSTMDRRVWIFSGQLSVENS